LLGRRQIDATCPQELRIDTTSTSSENRSISFQALDNERLAG
jgi:hypothetical protein